jgi:hypothetical protein
MLKINNDFIHERKLLRLELKNLLQAGVVDELLSKKALEILQKGEEKKYWIRDSDERLTSRVKKLFNLEDASQKVASDKRAHLTLMELSKKSYSHLFTWKNIALVTSCVALISIACFAGQKLPAFVENAGNTEDLPKPESFQQKPMQESLLEKCIKAYHQNDFEILESCKKPKDLEIIVKEIKNPPQKVCETVKKFFAPPVTDESLIPLYGAFGVRCWEYGLTCNMNPSRLHPCPVYKILYKTPTNDKAENSVLTSEACERGFKLLPRLDGIENGMHDTRIGGVNFAWVTLLEECKEQPVAQNIREYIKKEAAIEKSSGLLSLNSLCLRNLKWDPSNDIYYDKNIFWNRVNDIHYNKANFPGN